MRHIFIINPTAGKRKLQSVIISEVKRIFAPRSDYEIFITSREDEAREIALREAKKGDEVRFYACGGEGTVFEILNGMVTFPNASLTTVPCGSANDFLKFFGDKQAFLNIEDLVDGVPLKLDLIRANEFYCINQCSVGMDAIVAREMQIFKNWPLVSGSMAYKLAVIKVFLGKIGLKINIKVDDTNKGAKDCLFAVCANGPIYGGSYLSAPRANPLDKKLDYLIVGNMSKFEVFSYLKKYEKGTHIELEKCEYGNCTSMVISADKEFPLNIDGEIIMRDRAEFEIIKDGVQFIVPKGVAEALNVEIPKKDLILS